MSDNEADSMKNPDPQPTGSESAPVEPPPAEATSGDAPAPQPEASSPEGGHPSPSSSGAAADIDGTQAPTRLGMKWYVLRVASNKEEQVSEALTKKVRLENLDDRVGRILVPTAKEKRMKAGQVKVVEKKLYPGYVFVEMATEPDGSVMESVWFMIKETMGVGDFIGSDGKPTSMKDHDVEMMLAAAAKPEEQATLKGMEFAKGDRVKIREGSFENYEGSVDTIDETKGIVTVLLTIFGRATPVDVEYWQLEKM
jgi:transcriptional antiterminator NusG